MKCFLTVLALFQLLPYIQCRPGVLVDSQNKTGSWAKLARRLEFESHLELPSRFVRQYNEVRPTVGEGQLSTPSYTRRFVRRTTTTSARAPMPVASRRYQRADKTTLHLRAPSESLNVAPTPSPTGSGSSLTTVHITDENDFALMLPTRQDGERAPTTVLRYSLGLHSFEQNLSLMQNPTLRLTVRARLVPSVLTLCLLDLLRPQLSQSPPTTIGFK